MSDYEVNEWGRSLYPKTNSWETDEEDGTENDGSQMALIIIEECEKE